MRGRWAFTGKCSLLVLERRCKITTARQRGAKRAYRVFIGWRARAELQSSPTPSPPHQKKSDHKKANHARLKHCSLLSFFFITFCLSPRPTNRHRSSHTETSGSPPSSRSPFTGNSYASGESPRTSSLFGEDVRQRAAIEAAADLCLTRPLSGVLGPDPPLHRCLSSPVFFTPGSGRGRDTLWDEDMSPCVPGLDRPGAWTRWWGDL